MCVFARAREGLIDAGHQSDLHLEQMYGSRLNFINFLQVQSAHVSKKKDNICNNHTPCTATPSAK